MLIHNCAHLQILKTYNLGHYCKRKIYMCCAEFEILCKLQKSFVQVQKSVKVATFTDWLIKVATCSNLGPGQVSYFIS